MNTRLYRSYRQAEGVADCTSYSTLDEIVLFSTLCKATGKRKYSLDLYVSDDDTDIIPAVITIESYSLAQARSLAADVQRKIRYDLWRKDPAKLSPIKID